MLPLHVERVPVIQLDDGSFPFQIVAKLKRTPEFRPDVDGNLLFWTKSRPDRQLSVGRSSFCQTFFGGTSLYENNPEFEGGIIFYDPRAPYINLFIDKPTFEDVFPSVYKSIQSKEHIVGFRISAR